MCVCACVCVQAGFRGLRAPSPRKSGFQRCQVIKNKRSDLRPRACGGELWPGRAGPGEAPCQLPGSMLSQRNKGASQNRHLPSAVLHFLESCRHMQGETLRGKPPLANKAPPTPLTSVPVSGHRQVRQRDHPAGPPAACGVSDHRCECDPALPGSQQGRGGGRAAPCQHRTGTWGARVVTLLASLKSSPSFKGFFF